jgi:hypothetical protein
VSPVYIIQSVKERREKEKREREIQPSPLMLMRYGLVGDMSIMALPGIDSLASTEETRCSEGRY